MGLFKKIAESSHYPKIRYTLRKCEGLIGGKHEIFWGIQELHRVSENYRGSCVLPVFKQYQGIPIRLILPRALTNRPPVLKLDNSPNLMAIHANQGTELGAPPIVLVLDAGKWNGVILTKNEKEPLFTPTLPASGPHWVMTHRYYPDHTMQIDDYSKWLQRQLGGNGKKIEHIREDWQYYLQFKDGSITDWTNRERYLVRGSDVNPFTYTVCNEAPVTFEVEQIGL